MLARTRFGLAAVGCSLVLSLGGGCFEDNGPVANADEGGESDGGGGEDTSGVAVADETGAVADETGQDNHPPEVTITADAETLTEGGSVTFSVVVNDPDGASTVVGGTLLSGDQAIEFGPLVALSVDEYTFTISWDDLNAVSPIEFETDEPFGFRAEVVDAEGAVGFAGVEVTLSCDGVSACGGQCVDKGESNDHCGQCGRTCLTHDHKLALLVGACVEGECLPTFSECWSGGQYASCTEYCASIGQTCAQGGTPDVPLTGCAGYTLRHYEAASGHSCVDTPDFGFASWAGCTTPIDVPAEDQIRCCCTQ